MKKSRLQYFAGRSILAIILIVVFAVVMDILYKKFEIESISIDLYTTAITGIITITAAIIGRYGARETALSIKADNPEVAEMIKEGMGK